MDREDEIDLLEYNIKRQGFDWAIENAPDYIQKDPVIQCAMIQREVGQLAVMQRLKQLSEAISNEGNN